MILTYYKSIKSPYTQTTVVVPDHRTMMLKGYTDEGALLLALYVDGEEIDDVLVAEGGVYDALFADLPDLDFPEDDMEEEEYDRALHKYYAAEENRDKRKSEIFAVFLKEIVRDMKDGELLDLDSIFHGCITRLSKRYTNKKP